MLKRMGIRCGGSVWRRWKSSDRVHMVDWCFGVRSKLILGLGVAHVPRCRCGAACECHELLLFGAPTATPCVVRLAVIIAHLHSTEQRPTPNVSHRSQGMMRGATQHLSTGFGSTELPSFGEARIEIGADHAVIEFCTTQQMRGLQCVGALVISVG